VGKCNLVLDQAWETRAIEWVAEEIKRHGLSRDKVGILQLSAEYSASMAQRLAHLVTAGNEPISIEVVDIPYDDEFVVQVHPDQMDPYETFIVVDSGCMSGRNFTNVSKVLTNYGVPIGNILYCCLVCDFGSAFRPDICALHYDGHTTMPHFWWECKTARFDHK